MMAEVPNGGQKAHDVWPGHNPNPGTPPGRGVGFDRSFLFSIPGILTLLALLFSFCGFISVEVFKSYFFLSSSAVFLEFTVVTSWLMLLMFMIVATFRIYKLISIQGRVMIFIMIGTSAFWAVFSLISSAVVLSLYANIYIPYISQASTALSAIKASAAFGLLEFFALAGVTGILLLDLLNVRKTSLFEG
ncbi:hypothetical protein BV898_08026 [Hypsibius exemplaris]|uniref:MARVEL domain-containing protein n=1 Tax=Hypsibius exemplaris TaxID=2072580 RepID=A0A1W0WRW2_HYPEX|nr:hypothetical protein BV898_08026 [Hypsibius exemplaris]